MDIHWADLTRNLQKAALYSSDAYFRIGFDEMRLTGLAGRLDAIQRFSAVLLKPDAIARRVADKALSFLTDNGFRPIAAIPVDLNEHVSNALWLYQWNRASTDRLRLASYFGTRSQSLLMVLSTNPDTIPASVRLADLKGPADETRRSSFHLRSVLGMRNRMLSLIHCPDEPADLIREIAINVQSKERRALWARILADNPLGRTELEEVIARLYESSTAHNLNPSDVIRTRGLENAISKNQNMSLEYVRSLFGKLSSKSDEWDFITVAADSIEHHIPDVEPILTSLSGREMSASWLS